ncbi:MULTISPECIES: UTRA domain-containing protein [Streptomyces]|uniref:UTRA domain-containing protein n=1 Tax=Streptomyces TaxID=1883 RepID=UPI0027E41040|nr:UTRA domain-containing protein [Streptomyces sp. G2]
MTEPPRHRPGLAESQERVSARLPTSEETSTLRIAPLLAVLAITRISFKGADRVIEAAHLVLPGDRADVLFSTHHINNKKGRNG